MNFVKLPDIDIYIASTSSIKEANEITGAFMNLGIEFCFNKNNETFQFVLEPDQYTKMTKMMQTEAIKMVEDTLNDK